MSETVRFLKFLKEQDPETIIYLGTKNGSSYLEIDTAQELITNMDIMEEKLHNRSVTTLQNAKNKILELPEKLVEAHKELEKLMLAEKQDKQEILKAKSKVFKLERDFVAAFNTRTIFKRYLSNWTKLPERKVVESYPRTVDVPGVCVIVEGNENGDLWFMKEKK